jgi:hypothetical protein
LDCFSAGFFSSTFSAGFSTVLTSTFFGCSTTAFGALVFGFFSVVFFSAFFSRETSSGFPLKIKNNAPYPL